MIPDYQDAIVFCDARQRFMRLMLIGQQWLAVSRRPGNIASPAVIYRRAEAAGRPRLAPVGRRRLRQSLLDRCATGHASPSRHRSTEAADKILMRNLVFGRRIMMMDRIP
jgi:hypothetical protein